MAGVSSTIGPYRIVRQLGEGGMGLVFEAVNDAIERRVAIKVLHPEYARNAEFTTRFFNEARAVNRVAHPGIVQISDHGQQPDGTTYIVMELLDGESLAHRLARRGDKLPAPEVVHLGWQLADSLAAAHGKGVVHRDLKPENVMIVSDPTGPGGERTKLLDFGIAKVAEVGSTPHIKTKTNQVMGTPAYMSPEQCEGAGNVDAKSDVYALGVMLFEMLAGKLPFVAQGAGMVLGMHMFVPAPLLRETAPTTPLPLCDLVQRLLNKSKDQRPSMSQVAAALELFAEQTPLPKRSGSNPALASQENEEPTKLALGLKARPSTLGLSASQTIRNESGRRRLVIAGTGTTMLAAGLGLLWMVRAGHIDTHQPLPPRPKTEQPAVFPDVPLSTPDLGVAASSEKSSVSTLPHTPAGHVQPSRKASSTASPLSHPPSSSPTRFLPSTNPPRIGPSSKAKSSPIHARTGVPLPD